MPRPLKEMLAEIRELITGDYTMDKLIADLQLDQEKGGWPELHQQIFNAGHKKATAQHGEDIRSVERKLEAEQSTNADLRKQIKKLEDKAPDSAQLRAEYEERERKLKAEFEAKIQELDTQVLGSKRSTRAQKLVDELEALGVQKLWAQREAKDYEDRLVYDEKNQPIVLQIGQKIPYAASTEEEGVKALARDIRKGAPEWALVTPIRSRGSGLRNEGAGGGQEPPEDLVKKKVSTGDYSL